MLTGLPSGPIPPEKFLSVLLEIFPDNFFLGLTPDLYIVIFLFNDLKKTNMGQVCQIKNHRHQQKSTVERI